MYPMTLEGIDHVRDVAMLLGETFGRLRVPKEHKPPQNLEAAHFNWFSQTQFAANAFRRDFEVNCHAHDVLT